MPESRLTSLGPVMLVVAAPAEGRAALAALGADTGLADRAWERHDIGPGIALVMSGIGKVNAAGAVLRSIREIDSLVLSLGVAGALPGPAPAALGDVIAATAAVYADEGLWDSRETEGIGGFVDCAAMGFPVAGPESAGGRFAVDAPTHALLAPVADRSAPVATVSTCSGTDDLARRVAARTGAAAEAMEGAAVAQALTRLRMHTGSAPRFAELRVISNTTGDRSRQTWALRPALTRLTEVLGRLATG